MGLGLLLISSIVTSEALASQVKSPDQLTAQYFLRSLPAEIFDQTEWPLTENEKNYLVDAGRVKQWFVKESTPDLLVISSATPEKSEMRIKIFRNADNGGVIVVGTDGTLPCMAQFWQFDKYGRVLPLDEEPLVDVSDYFITMSYLPPSISYSATFCLRDDDRVEAVPSFWNISGLLEIPMEKRVFLVWNNSVFEKVIEFRSILLDSEKVEADAKASPLVQRPFASGLGGVPHIDTPEQQADNHDAAESDEFFLEDGEENASGSEVVQDKSDDKSDDKSEGTPEK